MAATTEDLKAMLDDAIDDAAAAAVSLREMLRSKERALRAILSNGQVSSVGKNLTSTQFAYGSGTLTQPDLARAWRTLIDLFDECSRAIASSEDSAIIFEMRSRLVPIREFTKDFSAFCE